VVNPSEYAWLLGKWKWSGTVNRMRGAYRKTGFMDISDIRPDGSVIFSEQRGVKNVVEARVSGNELILNGKTHGLTINLAREGDMKGIYWTDETRRSRVWVRRD
jgi:hypothetical protein